LFGRSPAKAIVGTILGKDGHTTINQSRWRKYE
jgi:hypothetical protein